MRDHHLLVVTQTSLPRNVPYLAVALLELDFKIKTIFLTNNGYSKEEDTHHLTSLKKDVKKSSLKTLETELKMSQVGKLCRIEKIRGLTLLVKQKLVKRLDQIKDEEEEVDIKALIAVDDNQGQGLNHHPVSNGQEAQEAARRIPILVVGKRENLRVVLK